MNLDWKKIYTSNLRKVLMILFIYIIFFKSIDTFGSVWSSWTKCSTTCGTGFRTRVLSCDDSSSDDCIEGIYDVDYCHGNPCTALKETYANFRFQRLNATSNQNTEDQLYEPWSKWSPCSNTCGVGIQVRKRKYLKQPTKTPTYNLRTCVGQTRECTKAYKALSDKRHNTSILKQKTALYKHLGLVAIVIVGVASSVFFISMLAIFKLNKR